MGENLDKLYKTRCSGRGKGKSRKRPAEKALKKSLFEVKEKGRGKKKHEPKSANEVTRPRLEESISMVKMRRIE